MKKKIVVKHQNGIHLAPAAKITKLALKYPKLKITLQKNGILADATSIISILSLELATGSEVTLTVSSNDTKIFSSFKSLVAGPPAEPS